MIKRRYPSAYRGEMLLLLLMIGATAGAQEGLSGLPENQIEQANQTLRSISQFELSPGYADTLMISKVDGAYYLGSDRVRSRHEISGENKQLNIYFVLINKAPQERFLALTDFTVYVTDTHGRTFDQLIDVRAENSAAAGAILLPDTPQEFTARLVVPGDAEIVSAYFADPVFKGVGVALQFDSSQAGEIHNRMGPLSPDGISIGRMVAGSMGVWYPLGTLDANVERVIVSDSTDEEYRPPSAAKAAVAYITVRTRRMERQAIRNVFKGTALMTTEGERIPFALLLNAVDGNRLPYAEPGQALELRMYFPVPEVANLSRIDLVEKIGTLGGALSRRYLIDLNSSGGSSDNKTTGIYKVQVQPTASDGDQQR